MTAYYQQVLEGTYDNHVLPFLWMKGESHKTIAEYLEKIAGADIHEVCLESRPHPDFCGEGWWRDLRFVIDECKQLGLKLWILDDAHFPTGFANGAVKEGLGHYIMHPETDELLHNLLKMLADKGEEYTFAYIKANVLKKKKTGEL